MSRWDRLVEMPEKVRQDPLGQSPDHRLVEPVGGELSVLSPDLILDRVEVEGIEQPIQRHPLRGGDFGVGCGLEPAIENEDEWPDRDRWQDGGAGNDIVETAGELLRAQDETDFLLGLADGGGDEVGLGGILPSAGKRHVAGPGIPCPLGPADQQDRVGIGSEDDGDRCPDEGTAERVLDRAVEGEMVPESVEPDQWL